MSVHAIRKCSIYVDLCRFQFNGTVEGLHTKSLDPGYLRCEPPGEIEHYCTITSNIWIYIARGNDLESLDKTRWG